MLGWSYPRYALPKPPSPYDEGLPEHHVVLAGTTIFFLMSSQEKLSVFTLVLCKGISQTFIPAYPRPWQQQLHQKMVMQGTVDLSACSRSNLQNPVPEETSLPWHQVIRQERVQPLQGGCCAAI